MERIWRAGVVSPLMRHRDLRARPDRIYVRMSARGGKSLGEHAMHWRLTILQLGLMLALPVVSLAAEPHWISARAYEIPPETTSEGSGYFSIIPGKDGRLY